MARERSPITSGRISRSCLRRRRCGVEVTSAVLKRLAVAFVILAAAAVGSAGQRDTDGTIAYRFSFPEPAHRWMQVEARFPRLGSGPLELRMSRSSPGRYS